MATFQKYRKNATIVGASEVTSPGNYGVLGTLSCGTMIIYMANGDMHTMTCVTFATKYGLAAFNESTTGTDWD